MELLSDTLINHFDQAGNSQALILTDSLSDSEIVYAFVDTTYIYSVIVITEWENFDEDLDEKELHYLEGYSTEG